MDENVQIRGCGFLLGRAFAGVILGGTIGAGIGLILGEPFLDGWGTGLMVGLFVILPYSIFAWASYPYQKPNELIEVDNES